MSGPAVFLDRDGTLNEDRGYVGFFRDFAWLPGAVASVRRLNEAGLFVVVVTNQAGVARGHYTEDDVRRLHDEVQAELQAAGAHVDAFYYAPHHPTAAVDPRYAGEHPDRKPGTGMFTRAMEEHGLDPLRSFMVGDKESDVTPGRVLGMTTVLVRTGFGREHEATTAADHVVDDVTEAADLILSLHAAHG